MNFKKILAILLCILCLFAIVACQKESQSSSGSGVIANLEGDEYLENLHIEDYNGYNFRILIRENNKADQYVEEGSSDPIEDAVYKRNKLVEEMFNIKISADTTVETHGTQALNGILAGDDAYDAIFAHTRSAFVYATQGAAINFNEIDTINLDAPWWSKDIVDSANINGRLYVLDGDISMHRLSLAMCMFFNKNVFDELGLEYPYELVEDGDWIFDEFEDLVKMGTKDLTGDGVITVGQDRIGFTDTEWGVPIGIIYPGGQRIFTKDEEGIPQLTINTAKTVDIYDDFFDLMETDSAHIVIEALESPDVAGFKNGLSMFAGGSLGNAINYRSMDDDIGILPLPKYDYDDEYKTTVNAYAHLVVMPITVKDEDRTGAIIEALSAIGSRDVVPAFYDMALKTKSTRDTESEAMIDIIKDGIVYDLGYAIGDGLGSIGNNLCNTASHDFSSLYASLESSAQAQLQQFNKAYGGIE